MIFSRVWERAGVKIVVLAAVLLALSWYAGQAQWAYAALIAPVAALVLWSLHRQQVRLRQEVRQFAEAVRYRDFSRFFTTRNMPPDLRAVREDFNGIIGTFKDISRERETQFHYLHNVLELVDTGILSYDLTSGDILWVNDTLKKQLLLPYIKTLGGLAQRYPDLVHQLTDLKPGERQVFTVQPEKAPVKLLFSATVFQTDGKRYKLIASQNISEALDENEARAWQRLLSVMTHEIMNSVAPIASLADTLQDRLATAAGQLPDPDGVMEDLGLGIETIKRRSSGLLKFAQTYRSLSKVTVLDRRTVHLWDLFDALHRLMQPSFHEKGLALDISLADPTLTLEADPSLMEQVLINLLVNAADAVKARPEPRVTLAAALAPDRQTIILRVRDNGDGIAPDVLDHIFVPFFTTKKNGSGIGLSLCKQVMLLHHGSIQVQSEVGQGTVFTLAFPIGSRPTNAKE